MTANLFDEYFRQRSDLVEASKKPIGVVFSNWGWAKALKEDAENGRTMAVLGPSSTYGGLHRWIDNEITSDIVVTELTQVEWFEKRRQTHTAQRAIKFAMAGPFGKLGAKPDDPIEPKTMIEIVAQSLDAKTLCDIIMHWLGADPHWGEFEKALHKAVEEHGNFE